MERQRQFKEVLKEIKFTDAEKLRVRNQLPSKPASTYECPLPVMEDDANSTQAVASATKTSVVDEQHNYLQSRQKIKLCKTTYLSKD